MKLKKNDTVIVISGKDKGKKGSVLAVFPKENRILVEGVNLAKVHEKPDQPKGPGKVVSRPMPVHVSNVMFFDAKAGKGTRLSIGRKDGKRVRIAKKSKTEV